jgi:rsbT co-antagonist protein RsbR
VVTDKGEASMNERLDQARATLAARRRDLQARKELVDELFHAAPEGVVILNADGTSTLNTAGTEMFKTPAESDPSWQQTWGFFDPMTGERIAADNIGAVRVMRGESGAGYEEMKILSPGAPAPVYIASNFGPLPGGGAISVFRNIDQRVALEGELAEQSKRLLERNEEHRVLIDRLRAALDELATPVLHVARGVLVLPIIGLVDSQRAALISERLLAEVVRDKAHSVVVDVTGVEVLDTTTADHLGRLARAVKLLGARCILSGVQPSVAQTLVALGVQLDSLAPQRNLADALAVALRGKTSNGRKNGAPAQEDAQ